MSRARASLIVVGVLASTFAAACAEDSLEDGGTSRADAGTSSSDGGVVWFDASTGADAGAWIGDASASSDAGAYRDSGASLSDASGLFDASAGADAAVLPGDPEGAPCTPDAADPRGSCNDPALECHTWSAPSALVARSSCLRRCDRDADCARSAMGPSCASVALDLKACVASTAAPGERIWVSTRLGSAMSGCAAPAIAVPPAVGSRLLALEDDQASCGLACAGDADCPSALPYCSRHALGAIATSSTSTPADGLCQLRRAEKGARCSMESALEMCDTSESPRMLCLDVGLRERGDVTAPRTPLTRGTCVELCTSDDPSCAISRDPERPATCSFEFFGSPTLGVCSDGCSAFPDDCAGPGSAPLPGEQAAGSTCAEFGGSLDQPAASLCLDVGQRSARFDAWHFGVTPPVDPCRGAELSCPDGTTCADVLTSDGIAVSACVFGCDAQEADGCASIAPGAVCTPALPGARAGWCVGP